MQTETYTVGAGGQKLWEKRGRAYVTIQAPLQVKRVLSRAGGVARARPSSMAPLRLCAATENGRSDAVAERGFC